MIQDVLKARGKGRLGGQQLLELDLPVSFQGLLRVDIAGAAGPRDLHLETVQLSLHALGLGRRVRQGPQLGHRGQA